ncbi:MAG: type II secretion system major pseudopilin GspG [Chlamydiae bacterium]|nr:type II secretion system major pseudopilin GspG [Chlamydiota bacterium]MBI3278192.1 type II secretion system major pseudopilin GspG [Chlamydiota bacterium]
MKKHNGFTLLEILVVMAILGILAVLVVPKLSERPKQAKRLKALLQMKSFQEALELFNVDQGYYPATEQGLALLVKSGQDPTKKYLETGEVPLDPWGHSYLYLSPGLEGRNFDIVSLGQDGRRGGTGWDRDIESWKLEEN